MARAFWFELVYRLVKFQFCLLTFGYRVYSQKTHFLAICIKTNDLFLRYPRKISLLKDLAEGISGVSCPRKSMKLLGRIGYPRKISLLKDLESGFLLNIGSRVAFALLIDSAVRNRQELRPY